MPAKESSRGRHLRLNDVVSWSIEKKLSSLVVEVALSVGGFKDFLNSAMPPIGYTRTRI